MGVKVTLAGDGLNYETETSLIQAAKIIGFLNMDEQFIAGNEPGRANADISFIEAPKASPVSSPREAVLSTNAKTNAQKILVLGAYIADRDNSEEFAIAELKTLFVKAGEPAPRNLARDVRDAVRAGYIMESITSSDLYAVTNTGRRVLQEGFNTVAPSKKARKRTGSGHSAKITAPDWLQGKTVDDQLEGYPSYRQLTTRSDRALWILQWAVGNSEKERITGAELAAIADKLSDNIPTKQVAASFLQHLSNNRVGKNAEGYKILYDGTQYLKALATQED